MKYLIFCHVLVIAYLVNNQNTYAGPSGVTDTNRPGPALTFTTPGYQKESLRLMIQEANLVATELRLPERLPITESNVMESFVEPYGGALVLQALGEVSTSNYMYSMGEDNKFCCLELLDQVKALRSWSKEYRWPLSRENTNAAYQLATQWLDSVSMDVAGLNRDCDLRVSPIILNRSSTNDVFFPAYWIIWTKGGWGHGSVAYVQLFLPTKTLIQLVVKDSKYILRKPIVFTNLTELISETNSMPPRH